METMSLDRSREWVLRDGRIVHRTGRYFAVTGVAGADGSAQPLLEQREIGTLGFLRAGATARVELLAQGKIEPGNVGLAQLAPTMQATASNLDRVHGGRAQFLEAEPSATPATASLVRAERAGHAIPRQAQSQHVGRRRVEARRPRAGGYRWFDAAAVLRRARGSTTPSTPTRGRSSSRARGTC